MDVVLFEICSSLTSRVAVPTAASPGAVVVVRSEGIVVTVERSVAVVVVRVMSFLTIGPSAASVELGSPTIVLDASVLKMLVGASSVPLLDPVEDKHVELSLQGSS